MKKGSGGKSQGADAGIRVMLVDDHPIVRSGVSQLVDAEDDMRVVGQAESAAEALEIAERQTPDVAVVDITLKESSGLDLIKDLQIRHPELRCLVLSMHDAMHYAERVLHAGALGYITKEEGPEKVVDGIREVAGGNVFLSENIRGRMLRRMVGHRGEPARDAIDTLTDRELQVFEMIGQGKPTRQVAEELHLSVKTIESHRENIKQKLGIDNATDLLKEAILWTRDSGSG